MHMKRSFFVNLPVMLVAVALSGCVVFQSIGLYTPPPTVPDQVQALRRDVAARRLGIEIPPGTRLDTVRVDSLHARVQVDFNDELASLPFREATVRSITEVVRRYFAGTLDTFDLAVRSMHMPIADLVPNAFRPDSTHLDRTRLSRPGTRRPRSVVQNVSIPFLPTKGLFERNIGLWPSHGWYYNNDLKRWEWQRPRLFLSAEDLVPTAFTFPYLIPMLENAGANVFVPRERDAQVREVVVDNDAVGSGYGETAPRSTPWQAGGPGFGGRPPYGPGANPFLLGTYRLAPSLPGTVAATWTPTIPGTGSYAVYVSYASTDSGTAAAQYLVRHLGGTTEFLVNQQIGGSTWEYLGTFRFRTGNHPDSGSVVLSAGAAQPGTWLTADAVRFGGGMGVIARNGHTSGRPKFVEGSRYWLQYAGMPDTLVFNFSRDRNDYRDDYTSRPEYLNYLKGAPFGPNKNRSVKGLGIPIDLSLAFHTDAGITSNDTTIGTLGIYTLEGTDGVAMFPDSVSRLANRDLADLLQTQIVQDVRATFDPAWTRRKLMLGDYAESRRPNMPSALIELLSHQNFLDMKFVLDPRFRSAVARAIYKGMLKFLAVQNGVPYVVTPLPVTHFSALLTDSGSVVLRWRPRIDPLEPTARADRYLLSTRIEDGGFDNGRLVDSTSAIVPDLHTGMLYSFRVTAINEGGASFPSEVLTVCRPRVPGSRAIVVNGFTRVSGPLAVSAPEFQGFLPSLDAGVPDGLFVGFTGEQLNFSRTSPFRSNDAPGHGASAADHEGSVIAGNTFDFVSVHGAALRDCGLGFSSAGADAVMDSLVSLRPFRFVDLILGKQKSTHWQKAVEDTLNGIPFQVFPSALRGAIAGYLNSGGTLFVTGAFVGADLMSDPKKDTLGVQFARHLLHYDWATDHAARTGRVFAVDTAFLPEGTELRFNTELRPDLYAVESADAVVPSDSSVQILRYSEDQFGAAVAYRNSYGVIVTGFPFEAIPDAGQRGLLMRAVLRYLKP